MWLAMKSPKILKKLIDQQAPTYAIVCFSSLQSTTISLEMPCSFQQNFPLIFLCHWCML